MPTPVSLEKRGRKVAAAFKEVGRRSSPCPRNFACESIRNLLAREDAILDRLVSSIDAMGSTPASGARRGRAWRTHRGMQAR